MRPVEFDQKEIIEAGQALQAVGRNVTGFALRQKVGGGNPNRLKQVWDEHIAGQAVTHTEPLAELPVEVAEEVATVTKALTERLSALAIELNDKAVKAAERRTTEVIRTAGEQREQAERELTDAAQTVDDLEAVLDQAKAETTALAATLAESQAHGQAQAVELAQVRERLAASEQLHRTAVDQHAGELGRANETAERLRAELDTVRKAAATDLDKVRGELANLRTRTEVEQQQHAELRKQAEQQAQQLAKIEAERDSARELANTAREEAARLRGQVETMQAQQADLMRLLADRPALVSDDAPASTPKAAKPPKKGG